MIENLFLGIGAMKAGTTWLYSMLEHHPDIYFTEQKEIHYFAHKSESIDYKLTPSHRFNTMKSTINQMHHDQLRDMYTKISWYARYMSDPVDDNWYMSLFQNQKQEKYSVDFSNLYSHLTPQDWAHIKSTTKNLKIIYIIRDPLKRLWSHVKFDKQVKGEISDLQTWQRQDHLNYAKQTHIWENTEYSRVISILKENFSPDQYKIAFFEDIHRSPIEWLRELEEFLDIRKYDYDVEKANKRVNTSSDVEMPDFYASLFKNDFKTEMKSLKNLGLNIPKEWNESMSSKPFYKGLFSR